MSEHVNNLLINVNNSEEENNLQLKYSRQNIQLRRAEVLRLQAMGESESSIARSLGCSQALISLDVAFLKEMAKIK
jgi:DNA-binding NarL/FixJ family response regulator